MSDGKDDPKNNKLTVSDKRTLDKVLQDSIKDVLQPNQVKMVVDRLGPKLETLVLSVSKFHSGPLPSVETAEGYEKMLPGAVGRLFEMAEKDQNAVITINSKQMNSDNKFRVLCMGLGFAALICILGTVIYLAVHDHEWAAVSVAGLGVTGIIAAFINARLG